MMPISREAFERYDKGMRMGLDIYARADREEKRGAAEREFRSKREKREQQRFDWSKEDRQKKQDYEVLDKKLSLADAHIDSGNVRLGAAMYVEAYNKDWLDGAKGMLAFRSDKPDAESEKKWDRDMKLEGKEISLLLPPDKGGLLIFKSINEFRNFARRSLLNPKAYLKTRKTSEDNIAKMNANEKPLRTKDGVFIQTWEMGPGGRPKRGPQVPYTGKTAASKFERRGLELGEYKEGGGKVTPSEEKEYQLGIKPAKKGKSAADKSRDNYKKDLDLVLRPFRDKGSSGSMFGDDGEITKDGKNALDRASMLIDKDKKDHKSLTESEKKWLPHARRALKMFNKISETVSSEYETTPESGGDWRQYRTGPGAERTQLPPAGRQGLTVPGQRPATPLTR